MPAALSAMRSGSMVSAASLGLASDSDSFVESALATHTQDLLDCLLNPESRSQTLGLKSKFGVPSLEAVLADRARMEPWNPDVFLEFCQSELSAENVFFYLEVAALKAAKVGEKPPRPKLLLLPEDVRSDDVQWASSIESEFVAERSPQEINIASGQRTALFKRLEEARAVNKVDPEIFSEAQSEIFKLMARDSWPRFVVQMTHTNINTAERNFRLSLSVVMLVINVILIAVALWQEWNRYIAFVTFVPWFQIVDGFVVSKTKVCSIRAYYGIHMLRKGFFLTKNQPVLECPFAKKSLRAAGQRQLKRIVLFAIALTLFTFGLTYIPW